ncbi:MAG TPA: sigma-70 family RNA polymerase sigma factor [Solirubrobacteraceae bacterium]|nr:sigma-70 family RNA polymerase sigma factor [Solirubrobacteraceae bacterium]
MSARLPPFQRFLDEQRDVVWRLLVSSVGSADAEDCFQETFIAALRAYPELRPDSNLRAWVLTIAQRKALDVHRARARRALPVADPSDVEASNRTSLAGGSSPGASEHAPAHDEQLWAAVGELPERQRSAVVLRFVADMRHREIAESIGCSEEAARSSLREGLNKLRKVVEV